MYEAEARLCRRCARVLWPKEAHLHGAMANGHRHSDCKRLANTVLVGLKMPILQNVLLYVAYSRSTIEIYRSTGWLDSNCLENHCVSFP